MVNSIALQRADNVTSIATDDGMFSDARIQMIRNTVAKGAPEDVFVAMLDIAKRRNLDPLAKQIICVQFGSTWQMIVTIDGYRAIAEQTGDYAGQDAPVFTWPDPPVKTAGGKQAPDSATVTVYKLIHGQRYPFSATVYWEEYSTGKNNWSSMPRTMLAKCFDPDTEVLTDRGFQRFDAVSGRILQVTDRGIEPTEAVPFSQDWMGDMVTLESDDLNFSVTPNHDMVTTAGKVEAATLYEQSRSRPVFRIPRLVLGSREDAPVTDQQVRLAAAYLADGYDRSGSTFAISVSRQHKVALLREVGGAIAEVVQNAAGREAQTPTRTITTRRDKVRFSYPFRLIEPLCERGKRLRMEAVLSLSQRQARLFVDTWMACDGHGRFLYTSRPDHLEAFEVAAVLAGYSVGQRRSRSSDIGRTLNYAIPISGRDEIPVVRWGRAYKDKGGNDRQRTGIELTHNTAGMVWCVTVPSSVIVVRRHGFSMLCGNCAESHALRKAFPSVTSGTCTEEEMDQAIEVSGRMVDRATGEVRGNAPQRPARQAVAAKAQPDQDDNKAKYHRNQIRKLAEPLGWTDAELDFETVRKFGAPFEALVTADAETMQKDFEGLKKEQALGDLLRAVQAAMVDDADVYEVEGEVVAP